MLYFFFFNDTATTAIYTLSLHDALPISAVRDHEPQGREVLKQVGGEALRECRRIGVQVMRSGRMKTGVAARADMEDRKSTRLNSSHSSISYAVFCLKKKKNTMIYSLYIH